MNFTVTTRTSAFRARLFTLRTEVDSIAARMPERAAQHAVDDAQHTSAFKDKTGATRKSLRARPVSAYRWRFSGSWIAGLLNSGTGLYGPKGAKYPIAAKAGGFLRFQGRGGGWVFRRQVMHPGVKASHFFDDAGTRAEAFLSTETVRELNQAIQAHNR